MISQQTFSFLADIAIHNDKVWFEKNKQRYLAARTEALEFGKEVMKGLMIFDETMREGVEPYVFRIYRDARFAKGNPYKTYIGILFVQGGRKAMHTSAGYYLHIEPGKCFIESGAYLPEREWLDNIRDDISENGTTLEKIIAQKSFQKNGKLEGEKLKTAPRGYAKDHKYIKLLRYKSFCAMHYLDDRAVLKKKFDEYFVNICISFSPLTKYLNSLR